MLASLRRLYRRWLPEPFRRAVRDRLIGKPPPYSAAYFAEIDGYQEAGYAALARALIERFQPNSVIDAGCGTGGLLEQLQRQGVAQCQGFEYNEAGRRRCEQRGLTVAYGDLSRPLALDPNVDLCVCLEVAEHLPPAAADPLVANLAAGPATLVFSAATPGQGGHEHLNEQPREYWVARFQAAGMTLDADATEALRRAWTEPSIPRWYPRNVMVFRRHRANTR